MVQLVEGRAKPGLQGESRLIRRLTQLVCCGVLLGVPLAAQAVIRFSLEPTWLQYTASSTDEQEAEVTRDGEELSSTDIQESSDSHFNFGQGFPLGIGLDYYTPTGFCLGLWFSRSSRTSTREEVVSNSYSYYGGDDSETTETTQSSSTLMLGPRIGFRKGFADGRYFFNFAGGLGYYRESNEYESENLTSSGVEQAMFLSESMTLSFMVGPQASFDIGQRMLLILPHDIESESGTENSTTTVYNTNIEFVFALHAGVSLYF